MAEAALETNRRQRRWKTEWLWNVLIHPRETFAQITAQREGVWLAPLLVLSLTALLTVWSSGTIRQAAAAMGEVTLPPDFQYYSPEQQAQYMQAIEATSGPVFLFVLPGLARIAQVWLGWLAVGGFVHLALTTLGGRGEIGMTMNLVAWAGLPLALRDLVRTIFMQNSDRLIQSPGLSGFAPAGEGHLALYLVGLLTLIDLYLIWHIALLAIGGSVGSKLSLGRALTGVLITMLVVLALQALIPYGLGQLGGAKFIQPFF